MAESGNDSKPQVDTVTASAPTQDNLLAEGGVDRLVLMTPKGEQLLDFDTGEFTIGRDPDCDLTLNTRFVSRIHARISRSHGRFFFLQDLSRNGTTIRQEGADQLVLRNGDRIALLGSGLIGLGEMAKAEGKAVVGYRVIHEDER